MNEHYQGRISFNRQINIVVGLIVWIWYLYNKSNTKEAINKAINLQSQKMICISSLIMPMKYHSLSNEWCFNLVSLASFKLHLYYPTFLLHRSQFHYILLFQTFYSNFFLHLIKHEYTTQLRPICSYNKPWTILMTCRSLTYVKLQILSNKITGWKSDRMIIYGKQQCTIS